MVLDDSDKRIHALDFLRGLFIFIALGQHAILYLASLGYTMGRDNAFCLWFFSPWGEHLFLAGREGKQQFDALLMRQKALMEKEVKSALKAAQKTQGDTLPTPPRRAPEPPGSNDRFEFITRPRSTSVVNPGRTFFGDSNSGARAVLSVIVDASSEKHMKEALDKLHYVRKNRNVEIGSVVLANALEYIERYQAKKAPEGSDDSNAMRAEVSKMPVNSALRAKLLKVHSSSDINSLRGDITREKRRLDKQGLTPEVRNYIVRRAKADMTFPPLLQEMQDKGFGGGSDVNVTRLLKRYKIRNSPAWIVRANGKDYVFEGNYDPARFFDGQGRFIFRKR